MARGKFIDLGVPTINFFDLCFADYIAQKNSLHHFPL